MRERRGKKEICRNFFPTSPAFINLSSARRWLCPGSYRSKLYFPAALPFPGLPSTCQSSLLKWFSYSTSPTAVCSCMPPSSAQLAFHTEMAPFKRVTRTDCCSLTMCKTWYFRQAFLFIVWSFFFFFFGAFYTPRWEALVANNSAAFFFHLSTWQGGILPPRCPLPLESTSSQLPFFLRKNENSPLVPSLWTIVI